MSSFSNDPYESIGFLANAASRLMSMHLTRGFAALGLNVTAEQWNVLVQLWLEDGLNQLDIAERLFLEKSSVSRLVDGLEKKGLVRRVKGKDARNNYIYLTEFGWSMRDQSVEVGREVRRAAERDLTDEELAVCKRALWSICKTLSPGKRNEVSRFWTRVD